MRIYVGNLPWSFDDKSLRELFSNYGPSEVVVVQDKFTKRSKGFGFITISDDENAKKAIEEFNGKIVEGRELRVSQARERV